MAFNKRSPLRLLFEEYFAEIVRRAPYGLDALPASRFSHNLTLFILWRRFQPTTVKPILMKSS